ncbi:hypothetical protein [Fibrobacter sp.]|uniref:hypothetical protein n=1 Tax=Fibrobacter sp. TaxID=35828 RepID=UPI0025BE67EF|nr:hypothetical protein [Fibrobacter sp.]
MMRRRPFPRLLAVALVLALAFSGSAFAQSSPLIMKHADSLAVARKRGNLLLHGRVLFVHDSVRFRTQHATWNKDAEVVQCSGGFLFTHPSGFIQAENGTYRKKQNIAIANGNVIAGDSANSYKFTGDYLEYDRENEILTMPQKPKLFQYEKVKNGAVDTTTIEARKIIYNKKFSFAEAYKDVKVTQKDMVVTCDTGYFDRGNGWLSMKGNPTFDMKNYHLTGDSIFLVIDEAKKTLKSALVIRNAHGISKEDPKRNAPGNVTEAFGDTLFCEFKDNKIERLYVNLNAKGFFYETDLPNYRNLMDGNRLDLYFNKGKMDHAVVSGKAQSTYFYVKKDRTVSGKNEAAGDTINIVFDPLKNAVKTLRLLGRSNMASGRYVDLEKEQRNKAARERARQDSLAKAGVKTDVSDSLGGASPDKKELESDDVRAVTSQFFKNRKKRAQKRENEEKAKTEEKKP